MNRKIKSALIIIILLFTAVFASSATNRLTFAKTEKFESYFNKKLKSSSIVSKKTFAQALAKYLNLTPAAKTNCYKDLKKNHSANPFICALKEAGIIKVTKSRKFYPNSASNWNFVVRSVCKAQSWPVKNTFSACLKYAKANGLWSSSLPQKTSSVKKVTYKQLTAFVDGSASQPGQPPQQSPQQSSQQSSQVSASSTITPPRKFDSVSFVPVSEDEIPVSFFKDLVLAAPLPTRFYEGEVYFVEGNLQGISSEEVFVFLCKENSGCDESLNFIEKTSGGHFKIPVHFNESGNYQLGVIAGRSGQSRIKMISVMPESPVFPSAAATQNASLTSTLSARYEAEKTIFNWNPASQLTQLVIFQEKNRVDYIFRQPVSSFAPFPKDFANFKNKTAGWFVKQNEGQSAVQTIFLTTQDFRKIETDEIKIIQLQEIFETPTKLIFKATALVPTSKKAAVTLPNGQVEEVSFASSDIEPQENFEIRVDLKQSGTYIFEVNKPDGGAIVNVPIYVGNVVPLLPDIFSLRDQVLDSSPLGDLNEARQELLDLINKDRATYSLPKVKLANDLNSVAQGHSQNMVTLGFFGHTDHSGATPDDRRKNANITTPVRENLGKATTLELVQAGLMRSPVHRAAIIDPEMKRVGLGIVKNKEGYFFVTQNFAADVVTAQDLRALETSLVENANNYRRAHSLIELDTYSLLQEEARAWSDLMTSSNFFGIKDPNGQTLVSILRNKGVTTSIQIHLAQVSLTKQLEEELLKQAALDNSANTKIGIGLTASSTGELFMTSIYTP